MSLNHVVISGNLTADPELRERQGGDPVARMRLAINEKFNQQETVCFVDVTAWGATADAVCKYRRKGDWLLVDGKLKYNEWEGKDGQRRTQLSVTAIRVEFGPKPSQQGGAPSSNRRDTGKHQSPPAAADGPLGDEDIPF